MAGVNPYSLRNTLQNPIARMIPERFLQGQVYRMGERKPPSDFPPDFGPDWEAVSVVLPALGSTQARINVQKMFHLMALLGQSSVLTAAGGFRAQLYDVMQQSRLADRGVPLANLAGVNTRCPFWLREPHPFTDPEAQILVVVQNLENAQNTLQLVLYGMARITTGGGR